MNVTLTQIARVSPEVAARLRDAIRENHIRAERRTGVAGRPYTLTTEALMEWDPALRPIVQQLENGNGLERMPKARRMSRPLSEVVDDDQMGRLVTIMESQSAMLRTLVESMARESDQREHRLTRMQEELQQLHYKLGQAHQEIGRLERQLAERRLPRAEEA
jgi:predicted RNase H-like nuclease (RuvC/YqgF family)